MHHQLLGVYAVQPAFKPVFSCVVPCWLVQQTIVIICPKYIRQLALYITCRYQAAPFRMWNELEMTRDLLNGSIDILYYVYVIPHSSHHSSCWYFHHRYSILRIEYLWWKYQHEEWWQTKESNLFKPIKCDDMPTLSSVVDDLQRLVAYTVHMSLMETDHVQSWRKWEAVWS